MTKKNILEFIKTFADINYLTGKVDFWETPKNEVVNYLYKKNCFLCSFTDNKVWEFTRELINDLLTLK